ncbi:MBL fold metallo-hydrolase [Paenibacillus amylolyticus]|uniref:Beta-lactamase n=1 Tax=Paenibacillus amylolyticus TaxID=1451 RepID=A0A100VRH6_PAEAM|nr:MBL fold metallo-hydrolase [Paenibacillus amylolyticus]GAS84729.1 beta-lactamase [Paenibacillus amylolyticus]
MIKLNVWGGAGEHGRSAYLLSGSNVRLLLDCGVKKEGTGQYPLIEPEIVPQLDAVFLSHAHEDHSVAIPLLYKMGYQGEVWTTRETRAQLRTYFANWRRFVERMGEELPYDEADEQAIRYRYLEDEVVSLTWFEPIPEVKVMWGRSGHLAGSVWFGVEMEGKRIFYSGDYTSESMLLQADCPAEAFSQANMIRENLLFDTPSSERWDAEELIAINSGQKAGELIASQDRISVASEASPRTLVSTETLMKQENFTSNGADGAGRANLTDVAEVSSVGLVDLAIVDAAYGTDQDTQADKLEQLERAIRQTIARCGKVLLPMPVVGRGQEILLWAQQQFPTVPIVVEQGLVDGMKQLMHVPYWLREQGAHVTGSPLQDEIDFFLTGRGWDLPTTTLEREQLLNQHAASLWFIPDGMMQSSLARWYYSQLSDSEENLILLTGHVAHGTFADKLLQVPDNYGACEVRKIRYKVHQGWKDVERMMLGIPARHTVLVHAERAETDRLKEGLLKNSPSPGTVIHSLSAGDELYV